MLAGLEEGFEISDELYLMTVDFESHVVPLLRGEYDFVVSNFSAPSLAPPAYENPAYRRFIENALRWVASEEARAWAASPR